MKKRKFQTGGDVEEQKRKGLETSAGEKVGFFERLRMGNIDDPSSAAYRKLGAGRGAAVENAPANLEKFRRAEAQAAEATKARQTTNTPAPAASPEPAAPSVSEASPKPATKAKAPVVTKEQMKKAGFDNLRDYLNAQRGLTRRGEKSKGPSSQDIDRLEAASTASRMRDERTAYKQEKDAQAASKRAKEMMADKKPTTPKREETGLEKYARILQEGKDRRAAARNELKRETRGMKKGGMVSASKRADGCAIRGKTRGRIM